MTKIKIFTFITLLITSCGAFSANKEPILLPGDHFNTQTPQSIQMTSHIGKSWSSLTYSQVITSFKETPNINPLTNLSIDETTTKQVLIDNYGASVLLALKDKPSETIFNTISQSNNVSYGNFKQVSCNTFYSTIDISKKNTISSEKKIIPLQYFSLYINDLYKETTTNSECSLKENRLETVVYFIIKNNDGKIDLINNNGIGINEQSFFKINDHQFFIFIATNIFKKDANGIINYLYYFLELNI